MLVAVFLLSLLLILRALDTPVDHDEDQYIAGAALAARHLIFRDFMHLQTPLQALLFAPLTELFPGYAFAAMRVANALLGTLTIAAVFAATRATGVSMRTAALATLMFALCQPFQMSTSIVRNDVLPLLLSTLGILAAVTAVRGTQPQLSWALAGLAFGLATSAKISHAFLAAGAGLFLLSYLVRNRDGAWFNLLMFAAGGIVGLLPTITVFTVAPKAALWGIVEYGAAAPFDWYRLNGLGHMLTLEGKLVATLGFLVRSFAMPALVLVLFLMVWRRNAAPRPEVALLDVLVVAGLIAALLPTPTWQWYLLTLLLPLFVRFAIPLDTIVEKQPALAAVATAALLAIFVAPQVATVEWGKQRIIFNAADGLKIGEVEAEAHWIGAQLRAAGVQGRIASLSPHVVIDSGYPLDERFATGVFVYRSGNLLDAKEHEDFNTIGPRTLASSMDREPPAAIVVGYENGSALFSVRPDDGLRAYAKARGYRRLRSPIRRAELFVNLKAIRPPAPSSRDYNAH